MTGNRYDKNVLKDFFAMTKFDCLIRPASSFSVIAEIMGDFKVIIQPKKFHWESQQLIIDEVSIADYRKVESS
jgi:hypothetical protein